MDITERVRAAVRETGVRDGLVSLYAQGATAALMIQENWKALGIRVLKAEREFNRRAGFTDKDDRLPKMFYEEPLPPTDKVVIISDEQMDSTFDF